MAVSRIIGECLDALLHPSARYDALTTARHRAFLAPRLLGSLAAFAAFPLYLVLRGAPTALEAAAFSWLIAPILVAWFLSRTGRYEQAHLLSSLALTSLVVGVAALTGGIQSFAAVWLVVIPIEAALSASRRAVTFAASLALGGAALLIGLGLFGVLPTPTAGAASSATLAAFGITSAALYASGLAYGAVWLARTNGALLNVEEERYRLLARNMSDVISRHNRNGAVRFISPAAENLLGTPVARLAEHGLFDRVHVADRPAYLKAMSDAARGRETGSVEFRIRRDVARDERGRPSAAEFVWVEMRCRPLESNLTTTAASNAGETEVVAVMRDITERKIHEQALDQARAEADRADAAKSRFLATMSHELRTPLNAIIGFSDMILQDDVLMLGPERRKEYAQLINDSGQHLLSVVNGILDMSKMESGSFEIVPEPFAPRPALLNCCNLLALKARDSGIDLVTRAPENLPEVVGDPRAFKQILLNLVSNAIKFTERGGTVTVSAAVEGTRLVLRVTDTGVGIAEEDLKRLGDPFFQAGKTYQRRHEGTGLGLSIVKSLVRMHGGEIEVQSQIDCGTTVTVSLPLALPAGSNVTTLNPAMPADSPAPDYQVKKSA
ncbi:Sensor histidine kinase RcsC [Rhodopseudomonas palustris]|uniref:histidine kinase n=1 Tax=Rhodopseudomonas palustris (strain ATCC BAA-98 / CGA009) TaxID=258594 RepID=Q6N8P5_RHOPA|nr:PAS domain-containing sensor histidine kinase [Rhodopseudomonas palustris]OPF94144.1 PAS domain-containing sensor histidine kinase [Rhodopseudomonas palustris]QQM03363.1 Sensor histidine kinase RcsC [Rhodopseudomonas palustris]RJF62596.1 PAS domain-containing sensor histidine kinase [Rhodopseudomonas palustris]WAB79519.1 PAS domain-containing sensor histidine kinase [Rhodopseudomonas palustris]WCL92003.1 PAS domain-containing sensor histidine kinase [Rhodopseudomonas palustris CGA009]